jgi:hypothetical protein
MNSPDGLEHYWKSMKSKFMGQRYNNIKEFLDISRRFSKPKTQTACFCTSVGKDNCPNCKDCVELPVNNDEDKMEVEEAPVETPLETPIEAPVETPLEIPVEAPVETPVEIPVETPIEAPTEFQKDQSINRLAARLAGMEISSDEAQKSQKSQKSQESQETSDKILNPKTGRWVLKSGKVGKLLLLEKNKL